MTEDKSAIKPPKFSIIDAIRTYRRECNLSYKEALIKAVEFFQKKNWEIPESIMSLYRREKL